MARLTPEDQEEFDRIVEEQNQEFEEKLRRLLSADSTDGIMDVLRHVDPDTIPSLARAIEESLRGDFEATSGMISLLLRTIHSLLRGR